MKQAYVWYFGDHAGIDFRSGTAIALTDQDSMTAYKSSSVISDSMGNLLFFTNGRKVWDQTHQLMPNATGLNGDLGVFQPCIIVPKPSDPTIFFLFTIDVLAFNPDNTYTTKGFRYTIIDMKRRGGMGDATEILNIPLLTPVSQKLSAVFHKNKMDVWIIVHKWDSDEFYAYLVSKWGIHDPVISKAGTVHGGGYTEQANAYGCMKFSPDGTRIASAISGCKIIELFNFNNETGTVSFIQSHLFTYPNVSPYGIEFSPDSKKLYTSLIQTYGNGPPSSPSLIYQFDLTTDLNNPILVDSIFGIRVSNLQLGPDGRIYCAKTINLLTKCDTLDVIYNPTRLGTGCNYNRVNHVPGTSFPLFGRYGIYSLPNIIQSYVHTPFFSWDSCCHHDLTRFYILNPVNIDSVLWNFSDGATSIDLDPVHEFQNPGTYTVTLTEFFDGISYRDSLNVIIHSRPAISLGDTILLYSGASLNLHAGGGYQAYQWSTGATDSIIETENQGNYSVQVMDWNCCLNSDSVYVKVFNYYIPDAFTPNGDGLNDIFKVIGLYGNIRFKLYIYDRWGHMIFNSDSMDHGWDGRYYGKPCPADTYVWIAHISFLGEDIITNGDVILKGTVLLLR